MTMRRQRSMVLVIASAMQVACGDPAPIRVGVVSSDEGLAGARLAVAEINASGGIHGRALGLRGIQDQGNQARQAIAAAESLANDASVIAVVGHSNSTSSLAASPTYNEHHLVQIAPTSSAALLSDAGPFTFRLVASDIHQARYIARVIVEDSTRGAVAVVHVNDDYGRSLHRELRAQLTAASVPVVLELPYTEDGLLPDVDHVVESIVRSGAARLVWLGRSTQLGQLLPTLRKAMRRIDVIGSDGVDTRETALNADGAMTGVQFVRFVDLHAARAELARLRERFRANTGQELSAESALTYDAVMLVATAARASGPSRKDVYDYVKALGSARSAFTGATGDIAFDANGDPPPSYCLAEVTPTGIRIVESSTSR